MADDTRDEQRTRPPAQAAPPGDGPVRNADPAADRSSEPATDEPRATDPSDGSGRSLGVRSFGGTNIAADQRRQGRERGAGLGAGGSDTREARHGVSQDRESPEDDLD